MRSPFTGPLRTGLRSDDVHDSPLSRRLVFVVADPPFAEHGPAIAGAASREGVVVLDAGIRLFGEAVGRPVATSMWAGDEGLASLAPLPTLLRHLRGLVDDLLTTDPERAAADRVVIWSPDGLEWVHVLFALFPDATVVQVGERRDVPFERAAEWATNGAAARWEAATAEARAGEGPRMVLVDDVDDAAAEVVRLAAAAPYVRRAADLQVEAPPPPDLTDRVLLVVGCPRSGTTWLEHLLLGHLDVGGVDETETWLFHELRDLWDSVERGDAASLGSLAGVDQTAQAVRRFADGLMQAALDADSPGRAWFVEKTPLHAYHLDRIVRSHPDAWVVHLVRDGRDVARSLVEVSFGQPDVAAAAREWDQVVRHVAARQDAVPRFRELRYEALVADPVVETTALCEWAGLRVDDDVRAAIDERVGRRVSQHGTTGPVGSGKHADLSERDLDDIAFEAGDLLVELGYANADEMRRRRRRARARAAAGRIARVLPGSGRGDG